MSAQDPDQPRQDLVRALVQSCWLVESARAAVLTGWGGEYAPEGEQASRRADLIAQLLDGAPTTLVEKHTAWLRDLVGMRPDEVPLGPGVVHRLAAWTDVYVVPFLGSDGDQFRRLGEAELRFPVAPRHVERDELRLRHADLPDGNRAVVLTDIHLGAPHTEAMARQAVRDINSLRPEMVLVPGDITDDGEIEQFELAKQILDDLDAPVHAVLGNHDAVRRSTTQPDGAELFEKVFGYAPTDQVLDWGPVQIALVDTTDPVASPFPDWDLARGGFREDAGGTNGGALRAGQAEALAARLDRARPTLLVQHHELQPFAAFPPVMFGVREPDSDALLSELSGQRLLGIVAGHTHRSALTQVGGDGVAQLEVPSIKDWPHCYTVMTRTPQGVHVAPQQISDEELVWEHGRQIPPIYLRYVLGPLSRTAHTFASGG
ncbi:MAG TPA: metallophosphoesterase [Actinomycetota bacterium]|nr:metallophosphoesterase [Actinomycetota bacterium]